MHDPARCKAHSRSGNQCRNPPMDGQQVCRMHGGSSPRALAAAERRIAQHAAEEAVATYGLPRTIDPHTALLEELHRTAGHVAWLNLRIQALDDHDLYGPVGGGKESIPAVVPHIWVKLYQDERKHFADVAKSCVAAGIAERQVQIAERQGQLLAQVIQGVLQDLGVHEHPDTPTVVRRHLALVADNERAA